MSASRLGRRRRPGTDVDAERSGCGLHGSASVRSKCASVVSMPRPNAETERNVRAIVFDLDGVVRAWDTVAEEAIEAKYGMPAGSIIDAVVASTHTEHAITGVLDDERYRAAIAIDLAKEFGEAAHVAVAEWSRELGSVNRDVLAYVAALRREFVVALLSNATSRLTEELRILELSGCFDHVFNTSEIGLAKPNPEVYAHVSRQLALTPFQWLFVDDMLANVRAAESVGVRAHHYRDLTTLRRWIEAQVSDVGA